MVPFDEFNTALEGESSTDSTIGVTYSDLDPLSPNTNLGMEGLTLDPSIGNQSELYPETWGGGNELIDPPISDQISLSGTTDPPPSPDSNDASATGTGSGTAAPQPGSAAVQASGSSLFSVFSKFGVALGQLFTSSSVSTSKIVTPTPSNKPVPANMAFMLVAILALIAVVIVFGGNGE